MQFGEWRYTVDVTRTRMAYDDAIDGHSNCCDCWDCRNFRWVRDEIFAGAPAEFLQSLGIDYRKDSDASRYAETEPGKHLYGGWFHFVGELLVTGDFPPVQLTDRISMFMCTARAPHLRSLDGMPLVQLEFQAKDTPWMIPGFEPQY